MQPILGLEVREVLAIDFSQFFDEYMISNWPFVHIRILGWMKNVLKFYVTVFSSCYI